VVAQVLLGLVQERYQVSAAQSSLDVPPVHRDVEVIEQYQPVVYLLYCWYVFCIGVLHTLIAFHLKVLVENVFA